MSNYNVRDIIVRVIAGFGCFFGFIRIWISLWLLYLGLKNIGCGEYHDYYDDNWYILECNKVRHIVWAVVGGLNFIVAVLQMIVCGWCVAKGEKELNKLLFAAIGLCIWLFCSIIVLAVFRGFWAISFSIDAIFDNYYLLDAIVILLICRSDQQGKLYTPYRAGAFT